MGTVPAVLAVQLPLALLEDEWQRLRTWSHVQLPSAFMSVQGKAALIENSARITWLQLLKLPLHLQNYWQLPDRTKKFSWSWKQGRWGERSTAMTENLGACVEGKTRWGAIQKLFKKHQGPLQTSVPCLCIGSTCRNLCATIARTGSAFFTATTVLLITFNKCMLWKSHLIYAQIKPHSFYYFPQPLHV